MSTASHAFVPVNDRDADVWQTGFLAVLPSVWTHAQIQFRRFSRERQGSRIGRVDRIPRRRRVGGGLNRAEDREAANRQQRCRGREDNRDDHSPSHRCRPARAASRA